MQILPHKKGKVNSHSDIWEKSINKDWQEIVDQQPFIINQF